MQKKLNRLGEYRARKSSDNPDFFFFSGVPVSNLGPQIFCRLFMVSLYPAKMLGLYHFFPLSLQFIILSRQVIQRCNLRSWRRFVKYAMCLSILFTHFCKYICRSLNVILCKAVFLLIYIRWLLNKTNKKLLTQICCTVENVLLLFFFSFLCALLCIPAVGAHGQAILLTICTTLNNCNDFINSVNTRSVNTNSRLIQLKFCTYRWSYLAGMSAQVQDMTKYFPEMSPAPQTDAY